jgi:3-polyprenyl-4-hydroxybenzoate decarboxylase
MKLTFEKGQTPLVGSFILIMVATIIGVSVVIPVIQDRITAAGTISTAAETYVQTITTTNITQLTHQDLVDNTFAAVNSTGSITYGSGNYTVNIAAGTVTWHVVPGSLTRANVTYSYYGSGYIHNAAAVTLLNLIPLFLVLIIILAVVALVKF